MPIIFFTLLLSARLSGQEETKVQKIQRLSSELQSNDVSTQEKAVIALSQMGKDVIPTLIEILKTNNNLRTIESVHQILVTVGKDAAPLLIEALKVETSKTHKDVVFVRRIANALARIAEITKDDSPAFAQTVPFLMKILENDREKHLKTIAIFQIKKDVTKEEIDKINDSLQDFDAAAHCLGKIGRQAKDAVPLLIEIMKNEKYRKDGYIKRDSIDMILSDLIKNSDYSANEKIIQAFEKYKTELNPIDRISIEPKIQQIQRLNAKNNAWQVFITVYAIYIAIAILFFGAAYIFLLKPLWMLKIYEIFPISETRFSGFLGLVTIPVQFLLAFLILRPHVLDAWVKKHLERASQSFLSKQTVTDRRVYVPIALFLDNKLLSELTPQDLQETFAHNQSRLLISGAGGAGKTSLACQIAKWAMSQEKDERLIPKHSMLPVLLEHDLVESGEDALKKTICAQLFNSIDAVTPISSSLLQALLEKKRVLVLIDGISEMNDVSRGAIFSGITKIPTNAVIFTSRNDEIIGNLNKTVIKPKTIKGNQLSSFVEMYLTSLGKKDLFEDEEFFEGCRLLSTIVNDREITALLAKLFVEQMVAKQEKIIDEDLPNNIPTLMLRSIEVLYPKNHPEKTASDVPQLREVIKSAKVIAWECLKKDYRPLSADYEKVQKSLDPLSNGEKSLNYLKDKLKLVETTSFDQRIRFKIDPLAEYLAGMYLVEENNYNVEKWRKFFDTASSKAKLTENITGFLLAVRDCCMTADKNKVPDFVVEELTKLTKRN